MHMHVKEKLEGPICARTEIQNEEKHDWNMKILKRVSPGHKYMYIISITHKINII